jgi:hypothetical protein
MINTTKLITLSLKTGVAVLGQLYSQVHPAFCQLGCHHWVKPLLLLSLPAPVVLWLGLWLGLRLELWLARLWAAVWRACGMGGLGYEPMFLRSLEVAAALFPLLRPRDGRARGL